MSDIWEVIAEHSDTVGITADNLAMMRSRKRLAHKWVVPLWKSVSKQDPEITLDDIYSLTDAPTSASCEIRNQ